MGVFKPKTALDGHGKCNLVAPEKPLRQFGGARVNKKPSRAV